MEGHHLIFGNLADFITGDVLIDTHDERYRQLIAHLLIERKGYQKSEIKPRRELMVKADEKKAVLKVDYIIEINKKLLMIMRYSPGSLVTRHRPVLAMSRLLAAYQIPFVVVTNGEDADILDGASGRIISSGMDAIPSKEELLQLTVSFDFPVVSEHRADMESRIVYAYEVDGSCPCDDTICRLTDSFPLQSEKEMGVRFE